MPLFKAPAATGIAGIDVLVGGSLIGTRAKLNLIAGAGQTLSGADNAGAARVDVTLGASSGGYSAAVLADNPAVYLRLGEATGAVANDSSPNAKNGSYVGGFTLGATGATTDGNKAVTLNGTTGYVDLGASNGILLGQADWTFECWVNAVSFSGTTGSLLGGDATGATKMWGVRLDATGHLLGTIMNQGDAGAASSGALTTGTYAHVCAVYTQSLTHVDYYINGAASGSGSWAGVDVATVTTTLKHRAFGNIYAAAAPAHFLNGTLDEVALYNTALTSNRILAHYNAR